jgi:hypothetical protein
MSNLIDLQNYIPFFNRQKSASESPPVGTLPRRHEFRLSTKITGQPFGFFPKGRAVNPYLRQTGVVTRCRMTCPAF